MKKLKHEAELFKAALLAGVQYAEGRGAVEFEPTDSASDKALDYYRSGNILWAIDLVWSIALTFCCTTTGRRRCGRSGLIPTRCCGAIRGWSP